LFALLTGRVARRRSAQRRSAKTLAVVRISDATAAELWTYLVEQYLFRAADVTCRGAMPSPSPASTYRRLERGMFKALHELQRLQATRAGVVVPPPVADVDVVVRSTGQVTRSEDPIVDLRNKAIRNTND
jgi:hypothetical protein